MYYRVHNYTIALWSMSSWSIILSQFSTQYCNYQLGHTCSKFIFIGLYMLIIIMQLPHTIQGLTQVEEMPISRVLPIMSIYWLPHGQYGYRGHVLNFPQDVASLATSLPPRLPSQFDVIIIRRDGAAVSHRGFRVRRSVVLHALQWLLANITYYHINQAALSLLLAYGDLIDLVSVTIESSATEEKQLNTEVEDYNAHLSRISSATLFSVSLSRRQSVSLFKIDNMYFDFKLRCFILSYVVLLTIASI